MMTVWLYAHVRVREYVCLYGVLCYLQGWSELGRAFSVNIMALHGLPDWQWRADRASLRSWHLYPKASKSPRSWPKQVKAPRSWHLYPKAQLPAEMLANLMSCICACWPISHVTTKKYCSQTCLCKASVGGMYLLARQEACQIPEGVIWGPKWVWFWHDPRVWSLWRAVFKLSVKC